MRVSDAAKIAGCSVRTVRYYHNLGLLPVPTKQRGPWRDYEFADVARLIQIRSMAQAGMRLDDIRLELSAAETHPPPPLPRPTPLPPPTVTARFTIRHCVAWTSRSLSCSSSGRGCWR